MEAQTTDRLLVFASNGRIYTLGCDKLPRGRGFGEPLRLMVDLPDDAEIVALEIYRAGARLLLASSEGRGFVVPQDDVLAQTRAGRQVLNLEGKIVARFCLPVEGDHLAVVGSNRKLSVYPLEQIPAMARGRGVALFKKGVEPADMKMITLAEGLSWKAGERTRTILDLRPWLGNRAALGRMVPDGFPRSTRFT